MKIVLMLLRSVGQKPRVRRFTMFLAAILLFYVFCLNYTEPSELGIARNYVTGDMWVQKEGGWHLTGPFTLVARVDTRPMRISVDSAGHGYSAKLVQFDPDHWQEFVAAEGFRYYWWANRLSFNWGYEEEHRGMRDILRGYAYGATQYSFVKVITEYK